MNSHLRLYLWKEWRDQRTVIVGVLLALPALLALGAWTGGDELRTHPLLPPLTAAAGFVLTILTLGMDVLAGEIRRGRVAFLERLPAGLRGAFHAKLIVVFTALGLMAAYGYTLGYVVVRWSHAPIWPMWDPLLTRYVVPGIALGFWAFAVSSWIPRSALAVPGTALAVAVLAWPAWLFYRPTELVAPTALEAWTFLAVSVFGSAVVAGASFIGGYRFGTRGRRIGLFGLAAGVLVLSPTWAWTAVRFDRARTIDPTSRGFHIWLPCVGSGSRFAFLEVKQHQPRPVGVEGRKPPARALLVDLQTGQWSEPGEPGARWSPVGTTIIGPETVWLFGPEEERQLFSARTGAPIAEPVGELPPSQQQAVELGLDSDYRIRRLAGRGVALSRRVPGGFRSCGLWDPADGRRLDRERLFLFHLARRGATVPVRSWAQLHKEIVHAYEDSKRTRVWARKGDWLISHSRGTWLIDPASLRSRRLEVEMKDLGPMLRDGRFLLSSDDGLWLFDPSLDTKTPVSPPDGWRGSLWSIYDGQWNSPGPSPEATEPVLYVSGNNMCGLVRFDAEAMAFEIAVITPRSGDLTYLGDSDEDSILVCEDNRRIVRHWFGSDRSEVLFPR